MPQLETIEPLSERSWAMQAAFLGLLVSPIVIIGVWLFWIQFSAYPTFWLLPAALAALVWLIFTYEAYTWR